jgi:hypothetical protein
MTLDQYLRDNRLTSASFAVLAGIPSKQTIHNYRHGYRFPTRDNLIKIRDATGGLVTSEDFVNQQPRGERARLGTPEPATA